MIVLRTCVVKSLQIDWYPSYCNTLLLIIPKFALLSGHKRVVVTYFVPLLFDMRYYCYFFFRRSFVFSWYFEQVLFEEWIVFFFYVYVCGVQGVLIYTRVYILFFVTISLLWLSKEKCFYFIKQSISIERPCTLRWFIRIRDFWYVYRRRYIV